jgi:hypothetical protein
MEKTTGLNFIEAVRAAMAGRMLQHEDTFWIWDKVFETLVPLRMDTKRTDKELYLAEDWAIVDAPGMMSFSEAVEVMKSGNPVKRRFGMPSPIKFDEHGICRFARGSDDPYRLTLEDIQANDWVIVRND